MSPEYKDWMKVPKDDKADLKIVLEREHVSVQAIFDHGGVFIINEGEVGFVKFEDLQDRDRKSLKRRAKDSDGVIYICARPKSSNSNHDLRKPNKHLPESKLMGRQKRVRHRGKSKRKRSYYFDDTSIDP